MSPTSLSKVEIKINPLDPSEDDLKNKPEQKKCEKCSCLLDYIWIPPDFGFMTGKKLKNGSWDFDRCVSEKCEEKRKQERIKREIENEKWEEEESKRIAQERFHKGKLSAGFLPIHEKMRFTNQERKIWEKWIDSPDSNLFIVGKTGSGKTHLAISLAWEMFMKNYDVKILRMPDLILNLRSFLKQDDIDELQCLKAIVNHEILVFDDFGIEKQSEWTLQTIWWLIDTWMCDEKKGLIITSNFPISEIEKLVDDRIASRITAICKVVKLNYSDRRIKKGD
jgi:DNA replication protein DnaC